MCSWGKITIRSGNGLVLNRQKAVTLTKDCNHPRSHIDDLVQERHNSVANALELCLSCTKPLMWHHQATIRYAQTYNDLHPFLTFLLSRRAWAPPPALSPSPWHLSGDVFPPMVRHHSSPHECSGDPCCRRQMGRDQCGSGVKVWVGPGKTEYRVQVIVV